MVRLARIGIVVAVVIGSAACGGGTTRTSHAAALGSASFVARYYDGAAHLVWNERGGNLQSSMDITHPGTDPTAGLVQEHLDLGVRVDGTTVTLTHGSDTPWTGTLDGKDLVLTWAPDGVSTITTTFVSADAAAYQSAASDASREYTTQQQATAARLATLGAAQQTALAARQAAHDAQVAAARAAHDQKVAAMRAAHDAAVAAMRQRQAAAQAKAAAHHH